MTLVCHEMLIIIPVYAYIMVANIRNGETPYMSWNSIHANISDIDTQTFAEWTATSLNKDLLIFTKVLNVYWIFPFFAFFGFTRETRAHYRRAYMFVVHHLGFPAAGTTTEYALFS